jgi:uncharacterized membrane protein
MRNKHNTVMKWAVGLGAVAAAVVAAQRWARPAEGIHDSAPGRAARKTRWGDYAVTGRTVTIRCPRADVYAFWREFSNLPLFMENLDSVTEQAEGVTHWVIRAPMGRRSRLTRKS